MEPLGDSPPKVTPLWWPLLLVGLLAAAAVMACVMVCDALWPESETGLHWSAALLDPQAWNAQLQRWLAWQASEPWLATSGFVLVFALFSALAIPGCAPLALLAGSSFGLVGGTVLVGLGSTLGALGPFLAARYVARGPIQRRLGHRLEALDERVARDGRLWLFWLRLVPLVPYPLLNPLLGLSSLSVQAFLWPSLAGLTLASLPYVAAGLSVGTAWQGGDWLGSAGWLAVAATVALGLGLWRRRRLAQAGEATGGAAPTGAASAGTAPPVAEAAILAASADDVPPAPSGGVR